jgi:hypothetical protein
MIAGFRLRGALFVNRVCSGTRQRPFKTTFLQQPRASLSFSARESEALRILQRIRVENAEADIVYSGRVRSLKEENGCVRACACKEEGKGRGGERREGTAMTAHHFLNLSDFFV